MLKRAKIIRIKMEFKFQVGDTLIHFQDDSKQLLLVPSIEIDNKSRYTIYMLYINLCLKKKEHCCIVELVQF